MFDEIKKITTNIEYDSSRKSSYPIRHLKNTYLKKINEHDSIDFSPTVVFLKKLKWQIKQLKFESKQKLNIVIVADKFEIGTLLDISNLNEISNINYNIKRPVRTVFNNYSLVANFSVFLNKLNYYEEFFVKDLVFLDLLFEKFINLNIKNELNNTDCVVLNSLFEEFTPELQEEFDYVNNSLFIFVKKLTGLKKTTEDVKMESLDDPILINKIKIIDDEHI